MDLLWDRWYPSHSKSTTTKLLCKLTSCGISGDLLEWIRVFLHDRSHCTRVSNVYSEYVNIHSGVIIQRPSNYHYGQTIQHCFLARSRTKNIAQHSPKHAILSENLMFLPRPILVGKVPRYHTPPLDPKQAFWIRPCFPLNSSHRAPSGAFSSYLVAVFGHLWRLQHYTWSVWQS